MKVTRNLTYFFFFLMIRPPPRSTFFTYTTLFRSDRSCCRAQDDALRNLAGGDEPPQRNEQLASQRDDHCLSGSAARIGGPRPVPLRQRAVLLEHQKAPRQLQHAAAHAG